MSHLGRALIRFALVAAAVVAAVGTPHAQAKADLALTLDRAGAYVQSFQRYFRVMIAEERYEQSVRQATSRANIFSRLVNRTKALSLVTRSELMLVRTQDGGWVPFRDVFEEDGKPVGDREQRLSALFLSNGDPTAVSVRAKQIAEESARYNIGNVDRTINVPTLPLPFVTPEYRARFSFTIADREKDNVIIDFVETARPTLIRTKGNEDMPVSGRFWIDESTGTVLRTEVKAADSEVEGEITVSYLQEAAQQQWVPARMQERYKGRKDPSEILGTATYSKFRRFVVSTSEEVAKP